MVKTVLTASDSSSAMEHINGTPVTPKTIDGQIKEQSQNVCCADYSLYVPTNKCNGADSIDLEYQWGIAFSLSPALKWIPMTSDDVSGEIQNSGYLTIALWKIRHPRVIIYILHQLNRFYSKWMPSDIPLTYRFWNVMQDKAGQFASCCAIHEIYRLISSVN